MMKNPLVEQDPTYSLLRLAEAITCWRAVGVIAGSAVLAVLLVTLGGLLAGVSLALPAIFTLLALVLVFAGVNGAGICLTDLAHGRPFRSLPDYVLAGVFTLPRLLGANILILLAYLGLLLAVALVLVVCKLPGLGAVLLVLAVPVSVLAVATALVGLYVAASLVAPAIWNGERVFHALSIAWTVTRRHPFEVMVKMLGGLLLSGLFAGLLFGILFTASLVVGGLAIPILGSGMSFDVGSMMGGSGLAGMAAGMAAGYGLVYALAGSVVLMLPLMVGVLAWAEFSQRVDVATIRDSADAKLVKVKGKVDELKERGQAVGASLGTTVVPTADPRPAPVAAPAAPALACPKCGGGVEPGDRFCEHCGHKMA